MVISTYLRDCGYKVIETANGDEALLVLQSPEISIDLVFSDVELAGGAMNGFELAGWVRTNRPEIQIVLAGDPKRASERAGELCDQGPLVNKPYEPQAVLDQIRRLLSTRKLDQGGA